jgi:hypothetical protein
MGAFASFFMSMRNGVRAGSGLDADAMWMCKKNVGKNG